MEMLLQYLIQVVPLNKYEKVKRVEEKTGTPTKKRIEKNFTKR